MTSRLCKGCLQPLEAGTRERNPRKWCSERCRVWAYHHPGAIRRAEPKPNPARAKLPEQKCALSECGVTFQPRRTSDRCCSEQHGKRLYNRESRADGRQRPEPWNDKRRDRYHRRRALLVAASTGEPVLLAEIAERDGWKCSLCRRPVDPKTRWPNSASPSLDHRVPLSRGGAHDPSNVFLAHLGCNSAKGDRVDGDGLLLTG